MSENTLNNQGGSGNLAETLINDVSARITTLSRYKINYRKSLSALVYLLERHKYSQVTVHLVY